MLDYDISDLEEIWREGDGEMPDRLKHIVEAAEDELLIRALQLSSDDENTIRYNATKSNKTVSEYIAALVTTSLHPA